LRSKCAGVLPRNAAVEHTWNYTVTPSVFLLGLILQAQTQRHERSQLLIVTLTAIYPEKWVKNKPEEEMKGHFEDLGTEGRKI